jgi:hypothetical protein
VRTAGVTPTGVTAGVVVAIEADGALAAGDTGVVGFMLADDGSVEAIP